MIPAGKTPPLGSEPVVFQQVQQIGIRKRSTLLDDLAFAQKYWKFPKSCYLRLKKGNSAALKREIGGATKFIYQTLHYKTQDQSGRHVLQIHVFDIAL